MKFSIASLAQYLGKPASVLLNDSPFHEWSVERSIETDLEELRIDYVFPRNGIDVISDENDNISTLFVYANAYRNSSEELQELPFSLSRQKVIRLLGLPSKSRDACDDADLGAKGAWDRFTQSGYLIHVQYCFDVDSIEKITLMTVDSAP